MAVLVQIDTLQPRLDNLRDGHIVVSHHFLSIHCPDSLSPLSNFLTGHSSSLSRSTMTSMIFSIIKDGFSFPMLLIPFIFLILHVSYGVGTIGGLFNFTRLKKA